MEECEEEHRSSIGSDTNTNEDIKELVHINLGNENGCINNDQYTDDKLPLYGRTGNDLSFVEDLAQNLKVIDLNGSSELDEGRASNLENAFSGHTAEVAACLTDCSVTSKEDDGFQLKALEHSFSQQQSIHFLEAGLESEGCRSSTTSNASKTRMVKSSTEKNDVYKDTANKKLSSMHGSLKTINQRLRNAKTTNGKVTETQPFMLATFKRAEERPTNRISCSDPREDVKGFQKRYFMAKCDHSEKPRQSMSDGQKSQLHTNGFHFRSDERAKKRKEFYSKLEEEKNAKKEEMTRMRAKTEKEDEEALKLLRRSLTFRASPLPGFYHEGPPPKPELKKVPTTQAKSPKFTSRSRRSVPNALDRSLQKDTEYNQCDGLQICKEGTSNETGRSADVTVKRERSTGSSENLSFQNFFRDACERMDERKADDEEVRIDTVCANRNENKNLMENDSSGKGPVSSFHKEIKQTTDKGQGRCGSNVLRNCANKGMALKSLVPGRISPKLQTLTHDMKEDMSPMPNKMNKKERLKALTPYFRKRESAINVRRQPSTLTEFHAGGVLQCEAEEMKIGT